MSTARSHSRIVESTGRAAPSARAGNPEAARSHVEESIRRAGSDLDTTTDRRGRPYSLVCTKNQASYNRRAKHRRQDLKDLELLTS